MHTQLDPQALALISGAFGISMALVRMLEHLITKRWASDERQRADERAADLRRMVDALAEMQQLIQQEQGDHQAMLLELKEIATILRERGWCGRS